MSDETDPPRKVYGLKPREFERLNPIEPGSPPPVANDVFAIRRELRDRERGAGADALKPHARPRQRRRRDYWLVLLTGHLGIVGAVAVVGSNPVSLVFGFSGLVLFTVGLTWMMWFVVDDY